MLLSWYGDRQRNVPHQQPTFGTQQHRSIAFSTGRLRLSRQAHLDAGRRSLLQHHKAQAADQCSHDHPLEAALPGNGARRARHLSSRPEGHGSASRFAGPDSVGHPQETQRRFHPLELPQTGDRAGRQQGRGTSGLERSGPETLSPGALLSQRRSGVRKQSGRHYRPVFTASAACRPPFKPWIGSIPFCRFRREERSVTASSTTATERFHCMQRWTPRPGACTEEPRPATPAGTSWPSSKKCYRCARPGSRFISSSTTSRPTKHNWFETSFNSIRACSCTSPLRIPLGSTKWRSGSPRSNARSSPAAFSPRSRTWLANSVVTSTPTPPMLARSSGNTLTPDAACALTNSLRQSTRSVVGRQDGYAGQHTGRG